MRGLKDLTSKPVVGVGRFTSPDTMVRMIRDGVLDFIGAARPSIADPFLPKKIEEGRIEDIRECIGCNICVAGDVTMTPDPLHAEPEHGGGMAARAGTPSGSARSRATPRCWSSGAGPAGLEAAMSLGRRGYDVALAEAGATSAAAWRGRLGCPGWPPGSGCVDYRAWPARKLTNVELAFDSRLTAEEIVVVRVRPRGRSRPAPRWRRDGIGALAHHRVSTSATLPLLTPDDLMDGVRPGGERVVIYDDDHYYMGGVLAELLVREGRRVTLVTPAARVSEWTVNTMEQDRIQRRLLELDVEIRTTHTVASGDAGEVLLGCTYTEREHAVACDALVLVTARDPCDGLVTELRQTEAGAVRAIGDAWCPATIAAAVWDGHRYAEQLDQQDDREVPFLREVVKLADQPAETSA